ncbi:MAG: hypothetical protein WAS21_07810 [Geminicoccaceae bacterium]
MKLPEAINDQVITFFIQKSLDVVWENLATFAKTISVDRGDAQKVNLVIETSKIYPSVCLLGLGRCGSNIAVGVSALVYNAQEAQKRQSDQKPLPQSATSQDQAIFPSEGWVRRGFDRISKGFMGNARLSTGLFLTEPIVFVGDLNKDIKDHFGASAYKNVINDYPRLIILDLETYQKSGAGNHPILGQYLANMILLKDPAKAYSKGWPLYHSYLIDSIGLPANPTRLFFHIFSAGGGTGAGMAAEFGAAQYAAFRQRALERKKPQPNGSKHDSEPMHIGLDNTFSSGIAILPHGTTTSNRGSQVIQTNAGRVLVRYLSQLWRARDETGSDISVKPEVSFDCLMLISNDIMRFAVENDQDEVRDVVKMEELANSYIAQQIFNVLAAQAPTTDYNPEWINFAGIDLVDTIKLDAMDLKNSLAGPVAIAYSETAASIVHSDTGRINTAEMLRRAISLPSINKSVDAIEGISILPEEAEVYRKRVSLESGKFDFKSMHEVRLFRRCPSVIVIVSLPVDVKLQFADLEMLKNAIADLFPETIITRYSIIIGTSRNVSLTLLISESGILCFEPMQLLVQFATFSLGRVVKSGEMNAGDLMMKYVESGKGYDQDEEERLRSQFVEKLSTLLQSHEEPSRIARGRWAETVCAFERKFFDFLPEREPVLPLNSLRVSLEEVVDALDYVRHGLAHARPFTSTIVWPSSLGVEGSLT